RDEQRSDAAQRARVQLERNNEPIVAVDKAELDEQQAREVLGGCVHASKIDPSVFKFPQARSGHSAKGDRGRKERRGGGGNLPNRSELCLWINHEGVPIEMTFEGFRGLEHGL